MSEKNIKTKIKRMKFRHQLAISFSCGILVLAFATSYSVSRVTENLVVAQQIEQGLEITGSLAEQSKLALLYHSEELARDVGRRIVDFSGVVGARIATPEGKILFQQGIDAGFEQGFGKVSVENVQLVSSDDERWVFLAKVELDEVDDEWSDIFAEEAGSRKELS